jgi:hypothetical protein
VCGFLIETIQYQIATRRSEMSTNSNVREVAENLHNDSEAQKGFFNKSKIIDGIAMIAAEVIGTALLMFFGCMGCIDWIQMPGNYKISKLVFLVI